jgi:hypothetical protein
MTRSSELRELWLQKAIDEFRPLFKQAGAEIPATVHVTCGWPSKKATSEKARALGECWPSEASAARVNEIFISPCLSSAEKVLDVLSHELCHAADDCASKHGAAFKRIATAIGLEGKMTSTHAGPALLEVINEIIEKLGDYPHDALQIPGRMKQSTRLLKVVCPDCGYTARVTRQWIDVGLPTCPCGVGMQVEEKEEAA